MANVPEHLEQTIRARKLLRRGQRVLVAVSGGLDSAVLLHALHALAPKHGWKLKVAHFNHQLRGRNSDADERFVRALAGRLRLPFVVGRADVRSHARQHGLSIEMAARALRHRFLAGAARRFASGVIALAHHADDQVELFFLRLLRGAGSEGLAGMKWRAVSPVDSTVRLVRPLLDVRRRELERYAAETNIRFREDATNANRDYLRNRIRQELLPLLRRRFQPAVDRTVLRLMDILGAESDALARWTQSRLNGRRPIAFGSRPVALQRRALQTQLHQCNLPADFELIEWLRAHPGRSFNVSPAVTVSCDQRGRVTLQTHVPAVFNENTRSVTLGPGAGECDFDGVRIRWRLAAVEGDKRPARLDRCECFDGDKTGRRIMLRHWRPGDRFQPIGLGSSVKLQDWFTNRKISPGRRRELVVAATAAGEIFWVEDQRIGERFKLTPRTRRRLVWRWNRA